MTKTSLPSDGETLRWHKKYLKAAYLVAEDEKSNKEIIAITGIALPTFYKLKQRPEFKEQVEKIRKRMRLALEKEGIRSIKNRTAVYQRYLDRLERVVVERGADETFADVPGWKTGLLTHDVKTSRDGAYDVYKVDTAIVPQVLAVTKQAAQELGQWADKSELSGPNGGPVQLSVFDLIKAAHQDE